MSISKYALHKWYSLVKFFLERFGSIFTEEIDLESDRKTWKHFSGLVIGFGPKGGPSIMRNSVN